MIVKYADMIFSTRNAYFQQKGNVTRIEFTEREELSTTTAESIETIASEIGSVIL